MISGREWLGLREPAAVSVALGAAKLRGIRTAALADDGYIAVAAEQPVDAAVEADVQADARDGPMLCGRR